MPSRYQYIKIIKNSIGKRYYTNNIYPQIPISGNDYYVITSVTDRLDLLANQFYGDSTGWAIIATANNLGQGTLNVEAGIQIRIPDPSKYRDYIIQISSFNSQR